MRLLVGLAAAGLAAGALAVQEQAQSTRAAWADPEVGRGSLAAGEVLPVQNLSCNKPVLASRLDFSWANPAGGLTRQQYRWEFYDPGLLGIGSPPTRTGTLAATATGVQVPVSLLSAGTGHFRLFAVGPGGWETGVQHTYNVTTALLVSCGSASAIPR
ncbi:hypothetical protein GCM10008096_11420 [Zhihengliuella salsuginis]|uniref:Uncharacterized protein n=2 Tax=Zhihengliuella salsuginis TaxID=578222 RepID=A0ABQ3GH68_9MICC|nr:hypothetical protein GCM10008096_11420 [Zhihengliuella salsuginis]